MTLPQDPAGYAIPKTDDGERWRLVRLQDGADLGEYATKEEAVEAAEADRDA